jgi:hypothetical protein
MRLLDRPSINKMLEHKTIIKPDAIPIRLDKLGRLMPLPQQTLAV